MSYLTIILPYKAEGREFDSRWGNWNFKLIYSFQQHYGLGVGSVAGRNEYQESSWVKGRLARKADNLTANCVSRLSRKVGASTSHNYIWTSTASYRDSFTYFYECETWFHTQRMFENIVMCVSDCRRGLDWMVGFIDTFFVYSLNYKQYSAIAELHNLQFTVKHSLGFSVFKSRLLVTELKECHYF
jgi:hypothetical protein